MSRLTHELLADIDKETVDFGPNYDESEREPLVLPTRVPNLLINGSAGIAVGMATNMPPHNLGEVIDATIALIDNPDLGIDELMQYVPGPDFPTAGIINGAAGIVRRTAPAAAACWCARRRRSRPTSERPRDDHRPPSCRIR